MNYENIKLSALVGSSANACGIQIGLQCYCLLRLLTNYLVPSVVGYVMAIGTYTTAALGSYFENCCWLAALIRLRAAC